jgi:hypothetical protein
VIGVDLLIPSNVCPFSGVVVRGASMPIVHVLTTSDLMRPIRIPTSAGRGAERPTMGSCIRCPIRRLCCRPSLQEPPRWSPGPQMEAKQNTLAQAGVRRNRLKNNTTRLSSAPDQAICNCWHKRTLAGYLRQCTHRQVLTCHCWDYSPQTRQGLGMPLRAFRCGNLLERIVAFASTCRHLRR